MHHAIIIVTYASLFSWGKFSVAQCIECSRMHPHIIEYTLLHMPISFHKEHRSWQGASLAQEIHKYAFTKASCSKQCHICMFLVIKVPRTLPSASGAHKFRYFSWWFQCIHSKTAKMTFWHFRQQPGPSANARTGESSGGYGREMLIAMGARWRSVSVFDTTLTCGLHYPNLCIFDYTRRQNRGKVRTWKCRQERWRVHVRRSRRKISVDWLCVFAVCVCPSVCMPVRVQCSSKYTCSGRLFML